MMRLGVRAHDFGKDSPDVIAQRVADKGYSSVQLALSKAIEGIDTSLGKLNPGMGFYIKEVFKKRNIQIAVLGCYIDPINSDIVERRQQLDRFKEHIRFARDFDCSVVGTETGNILLKNEKEKEEAYETFLSSLKELVMEAERFGVFVGIEGVKIDVISSPQKMRKVLDNIGSNNLQVIYDPVNYLSIENYKNQNDLITEAFELFGDRMVAIHAKDFVVNNGVIEVVAPGKGELNYELLLKLIKEKKPLINILFDEIKEINMDESIEFVRNIYDRI